MAPITGEDAKGWTVDLEIRNGTTINGYSPGGTGWQGLTLVLEDGTIVEAQSDAPDLRDAAINQSAGNRQKIRFETNSTSKPNRLILRFNPEGAKDTPIKYTIADPTFRVDLRDLN
jgi:hypothetical protein